MGEWATVGKSKSETLARKAFSAAERERFHNLLKMAAESTFEGERDNALAAAKRMAKRAGMTLDEAAAAGPMAPVRKNKAESREAKMARAAAANMVILDTQIQADKARREAALRAARDRGLDREKQRRAPPPRRAAKAGRARNQFGHAQVLLKETSLPLEEVASITGLDMYQVVALKLKMRDEKTGTYGKKRG